MKKIIRKICLLYFFLILYFTTFAQNNLPPAYEIRNDTASTQYLGSKYWQLLPDKNSRWTINDVSKTPLINNFYFRNNPPKNADTISNTYWFRYRLKNAMGIEAKISINALFEVENLYIIDSNKKIKHYLTGDYVEWSKKDGFKPVNQIPLLLQPNEEIIVYEQGKNHVAGIPENFSVDISSTEKIHQEYIQYVENEDNFFSIAEMENAFLAGILLIPFFLNLFFFRLTKEKEYLYFSLSLIFLAITRLLNSFGIYSYWRDRPLEPYLGYFNLCWVVIPFFLVQFIRYYFKTFIDYPRWDKLIFALAILHGAVFLTFELIEPSWGLTGSKHTITPPMFFAASIIHSLGSFSIAVTFGKYRKNKDRFMNLVIIGGLPLMLFWGIETLLEGLQKMDIAKVGLWNSALYIPEIVCIIWFVLFFSLVLLKRFNQLRIENAQQALDKERLAKEKEIERSELIEKQKVELEKTVDERTSELKHSLENLKSAQAQLIQSEKMASLGQLTAGIAHEIQNPLNFVNNFSEVSNELVDEMKEELATGNMQLATEIADDIKQNLDKINYHGKRADSIVKGMLQHSRASTGKRELTDINALVDECVRLSFYGLRAKDKEFNAEVKTELDESIDKVNIVPQDISRVLLNLLNNAFYAVDEEKRQLNGIYEPAVTVCTRKLDGKVEIHVKDNGNGIPQNIVDKIFQPFFTTKPTGQGTGLGLSLSYDIIKAHGGEIKVESKEGEGSEFIIYLTASRA